MNTMQDIIDPRIAELEELATSEGITLPYSADYIVWLEEQGRIADLMTGTVYNAITIQPTRIAKAVNHLLTPSTIPA